MTRGIDACFAQNRFRALMPRISRYKDSHYFFSAEFNGGDAAACPGAGGYARRASCMLDRWAHGVVIQLQKKVR